MEVWFCNCWAKLIINSYLARTCHFWRAQDRSVQHCCMYSHVWYVHMMLQYVHSFCVGFMQCMIMLHCNMCLRLTMNNTLVAGIALNLYCSWFDLLTFIVIVMILYSRAQINQQHWQPWLPGLLMPVDWQPIAHFGYALFKLISSPGTVVVQ